MWLSFKSNTFTLILSHYLFSSIIDIFDNVFVLFCQFPIFHHFLYPTQWRLRNSSCVFLWVHQLMETILREFISESYTKNISLAMNIPPNRFELRATVIIRVTTTTHLSVWCDRGWIYYLPQPFMLFFYKEKLLTKSCLFSFQLIIIGL